MVGAIIGSGYAIWHFNDTEVNASNDVSVSITNVIQMGKLTSNFTTLKMYFDQSKTGRENSQTDSSIGTKSANGIYLIGYDESNNIIEHPGVTYDDTDVALLGVGWTFKVTLKLTEEIVSYIDINNITNLNDGDWKVDSTTTPGSIIFTCNQDATSFDWSKIKFNYVEKKEPTTISEYNTLANYINQANDCTATYEIVKFETNYYTVKFEDVDGNEIGVTTVNEGCSTYYPGSISDLVSKYYSYTDTTVTQFAGWENQTSYLIKNVTENMTIKVRTKTIERSKNGTYNDSSSLNGLPVKWRYLSDDGNGNYQFVSEYLIGTKNDNYVYNGTTEKYSDGSSANNYAKSEIRSKLNNEVLNSLFTDQSLLATTNVNNGETSSNGFENEYLCEDTQDKLYLLSYQDVNNISYGFTNDNSRITKFEDGTEFFWWLRTPNTYTYTVGSTKHIGDFAYFIGDDGGITSYYGYPTPYMGLVNFTFGVHPACTFNLGI
jgi:hypothetical protein